jgi:hypothetical protein
VNVTFLAPDSLDDSITEYTNGFLYYALAVTIVAAVIALVLEKIINYRVRTHSILTAEVVLHNEIAKLLTLGTCNIFVCMHSHCFVGAALGMLVGYAWSNFIIRATALTSNAIVSAIALALIFTSTSACASVWLTLGFEGKSENVVDILPDKRSRGRFQTLLEQTGNSCGTSFGEKDLLFSTASKSCTSTPTRADHTLHTTERDSCYSVNGSGSCTL